MSFSLSDDKSSFKSAPILVFIGNVKTTDCSVDENLLDVSWYFVGATYLKSALILGRHNCSTWSNSKVCAIEIELSAIIKSKINFFM
jgi:hypothetical protein